MHRVQFSDPLGDTDMFGGNSFDRQKTELEANKSASRAAKVTVTPGKAANLVEFTSDRPGIATVSPTRLSGSPATLTVSGVERGLANISARRYSGDSLGASVLTPKQVTMKMHIIRDNSGHAAQITEAQALALLADVNAIWGNQANITFGPGVTVNTVEVTTNLGDHVDLNSTPNPDRPAITNAAYESTFFINLYFVHSLQRDGVGLSGAAPDDALNEVFAATDAKDLKRAVAHELGHTLGLRASRGCDVDYDDFVNAASIGRVYQLMYGNAAPVPVNGGRTLTPFQGTLANEQINIATPLQCN